MDLLPAEEQLLLKESARRFLAEQYPKFREAPAARPGFSPAAWAGFADMGWLALALPESVGGFGGKMEDVVLISEQFGAALVVEPYLPVIISAQLIAKLGDDEQHAILDAVLAGTHLLALAVGETPRRAALEGIATRAAHSQGTWVLNGAKTAVRGGGLADTLLVLARLDGMGGFGLFMIDPDAPGVTRRAWQGADGADFADMEFRNVTMPPSALLGARRDILPHVEAALDRTAIALCADAVGAMKVLLAATVEYAKTRVQFGKPIGSFQALTHRMADMAVKQAEAEAILLLGALKAEAPSHERVRAVSAARVKIAECARFIGQQAVQLHGGMGVTEELPVGAYFKRLTVFELVLGDINFHLRRYAWVGRTGVLREGLLSVPEMRPEYAL
ncbi:acyl-CoA dehydrogenase [Acidocella aquatica]|uniref:Acyl-CoA dehydrogenase n=1 Tax=Acidocella aquatica TaxID=1922313 RepID=A0ABQ6AD67_9PROT|nr:acyl-CoA dehydrogenase [Acidocella aquatica]GLR68587.1 acyl-CoA dehydrogenase [Acidocella aquatica]